MQDHGLAILPDLLSRTEVDEICNFLDGQKVIGPGGCAVALHDLPVGTAMAAYPLATIVACPGLMKAINRPEMLQLAAGYLGCMPTISGLGIRWSFPRPQRLEPSQSLHRDPDDWRFLKLFVYLTDVDPQSGPHVYVLGSNRTAGRIRLTAYDRASLEKRYGADNIRPILGARGTTFMADTHGIHMGMPPVGAPRLLLQAQYSILPNFSMRYEPVAHPLASEVDPYVNRLIIRPADT
jgi:hypothetical protein